jgi:phosphatidylglycerophosphate synthase
MYTFANMSETEPNAWQRVAAATHDIVTPANAIDVAAFGLAIHAAPRLDTGSGVVKGAIAFMADFVDGKVARATGTASELGAKIDPVGDKIKLGYSMYHIWQKRLASRGLIAAVALQNAGNTAITLCDQAVNDEPQVAVTSDGKKAMFTQAWGIGLQVIGTRVERSHEKSGRAIKVAGAVLGWGGLAVFGIKSTVDYYNTARGGNRKQPRL